MYFPLASTRFWYKSRQEMAAARMGHIPGEMVDQLEKAFDHEFPVSHV